MSRRALAVAAAAALGACRSPAPFKPPPANQIAEWPGEPITAHPAPRGPITEESLAGFLSHRFADQLAAGTFVADYSGTTEDLLDELRTMGFHDLADVAAIIPPDFEVGGAGEFVIEDPANIPGLVRDFLMIHDANLFFARAWKNRWQSILPANVSALRNYVDDFTPFYAAKVLTPEEVRGAPTVSYPAPAAVRAPPSLPHP